MKSKPDQTGFSLIEIMISLLIGAFLLGGVLQIFIGSKQTYRMQEALSRMQENGRFALDFLANDIRMAGYTACLTFTAPSPINGTNDAGLNTSDTIIIQISTSNCSTPPTATPVSTITYSVQTGASGQPALFKNDGTTTSELVESIENMQILYGVDTDSDKSANYYVPADPALNWPKVVSARITLTVRTIDGNLTTTGDGRIRRNFTSTIALRNRLR